MRNLLVLFICLNVFPCSVNIMSDSGIRGKAYKEIIQDLKNLESQSSFPVNLIKYGETKKGTPLYVVRLGSPAKKSKAVLISGATHGNEYLNIADRLPEWFAYNHDEISSFFSNNGVIYIVPIFNPDGYTSIRRENSNGKDLNRDFSLERKKEYRFVENETKSWKNFLDKEIDEFDLNVKLSIDYHCCYGALLFPWAYTLKIPLEPKPLKEHEALGKFMQSEIDEKYIYGSTGQILWYTPKGTSKDFYYDKFDSLSATFEGEYKIEDKNFDKHTNWWVQMINTL